jgi:pimeloyl-ACP methyl ester carboxylesterase
LHGSPGSAEDVAHLAARLALSRRVIAPDLPGFGRSSRTLPNYSFLSHASYVCRLFNELGISRAHVLGFSMGGGVALSLFTLCPGRVKSVVLLSAIGVQEMELLGEYHLNHVVHGVQLAGLWLLGRALPDRGALDRTLSYARNFYDSDQRPLRKALDVVGVPVLIVHGVQDPFVPIEAAREHARLIPQSELYELQGTHFMLFEDSDRLAPIVAGFLSRVDDRRAVDRTNAESNRSSAATQPFDRRIVPPARAVTALMLSLVIAITITASGNLGSILGGVLVSQGRLGLFVALVSCVAGSCVYAWCRHSRRPWLRHLAATMVAFVTGVTGGAVLLRTSFLSTTDAWMRALVVTLIVAGLLAVAVPATSHKNRRLLRSSWLRLTKWEYWPPWASYVPLVIWIAVLAIRHRSFVVFTAANPAIPASGFIGESKIDILRGLSGSAERIARSAIIVGSVPTTVKRRLVDTFMQREGLSLPVVLKPNAGQRGSGVVVARSNEELDAYLDRCVVDTIVQEYVDGAEFGVFYCRRPSEIRGRIISVTEKRLPFVVGDGVRSLERLILDDDRAVGMARFHLRRQQNRLNVVPKAGEAVLLGDLGTHCRGALFLDGRAFLTHELERAFDELSKGFDGFHFGRYDVRVTSLAEFERGLGFKVIELNGVTSEATHIYDPGIGLCEAYRALFEQWRLAFEIGAENVRRGATVTSLWALGRLLLEYRDHSQGHLEEHRGNRHDDAVWHE